MKRWTKKDLKLCTDQLQNHILFNRLYYPVDAIKADIRVRRRAIVEVGLASFASMFKDRAQKNADTAKYFEEHPEIYGASTPEMVKRFADLAAGDAKAAASIQKVIDRVAAEDLPPEIEAWEHMT